MRTCDITAKMNGYIVEITADFEVTENIVNKLMEGFRDIEVIDSETGELLFQFYMDDELFHPTEKAELIVASIFWG